MKKVIATSVIRSSSFGESHGGVYLVDLVAGKSELILDWDDKRIDWSGRGGERGLRGIAIWDDYVILANAKALLVFDRQFKLLGTYVNKYLAGCHEICVENNMLYATSTIFDSVLGFDLTNARFTVGYTIRKRQRRASFVHACSKYLPAFRRFQYHGSLFDPQSDNGPSSGDFTHINNVWADDNRLFVAGTKLDLLVEIKSSSFRPYAQIPVWTHNARPYGGKVIMNSTKEKRVLISDRRGREVTHFPVPSFDRSTLKNVDIPSDYAEVGFGRGLVVDGAGPNTIVGGCSPATLTVYQLGSPKPVKSIQLSNDVRNAIHGVEIWPFQ